MLELNKICSKERHIERQIEVYKKEIVKFRTKEENQEIIASYEESIKKLEGELDRLRLDKMNINQSQDYLLNFASCFGRFAIYDNYFLRRKNDEQVN